MEKANYFDEHGNYINCENLSLAEIYTRAAAEGYKKGYTDASISSDVAKCSADITNMTDNLYDRLMNGGV